MQIGLVGLPANLAEAASVAQEEMLLQRHGQNNKDEARWRKTGGHLCPHMCMPEWVCTHMCMYHIQTHIHISGLWKNNIFMRLTLIASLVHKMFLADLTIGDSCLMASVLPQCQEMHHELGLFMHFPPVSLLLPNYITFCCTVLKPYGDFILDFQLCPIPSRVSLCSPGWPGTCCVDQADLDII